MCATGLCYFRASADTLQDQWDRLEWDEGPPWRLQLYMEHLVEEKVWRLSGRLRRNDHEMDLADPKLLVEEGLLIFSREDFPGEGRIAAFDHQGAFAWANTLRREGAAIIPEKYASEFAFEVIKKGSPATAGVARGTGLRICSRRSGAVVEH